MCQYLYPAAHHDRFIHSLGTYHLGRRLLSCLLQNRKDEDTQNFLGKGQIANTFLVACLMHDCGHAPFSHTFEGFYNYTESATTKRAYELLNEEFPGSDFKVEGSFDPAPHEAFSAVVLNRFYSAELDKYGCDKELAARMITGCMYPDAFWKTVFSLEPFSGPVEIADKVTIYLPTDGWGDQTLYGSDG